jgi:hypothetical protein
MLKICANEKIGLSRPQEQRQRICGRGSRRIELPSLRFTNDDVRDILTQIYDALTKDIAILRKLKLTESNFGKNGGGRVDFFQHKKKP